MQRQGFYARGPGNYRWSMARPFHVALEDSYVRANWDDINAICKFNGILSMRPARRYAGRACGAFMSSASSSMP